MVLEAVNENRTACFGWALEQALNDDAVRLSRKRSDCRHHHRHRRLFLRPFSVSPTPSESRLRDSAGTKPSAEELTSGERPWLWCPTWYELRTHYFKEIGFLASFSQLLGATVFWIAGISALPPVYERLHGASLNGVYWSPQVGSRPESPSRTGPVLMPRRTKVVGGTGFIISSCLIMLEVQDRWYAPNLRSLGWHIGFWNLVGAIGFTLCGALGYGVDRQGVEYAATLSTFIGSWAFLVSRDGTRASACRDGWALTRLDRLEA